MCTLSVVFAPDLDSEMKTVRIACVGRGWAPSTAETWQSNNVCLSGIVWKHCSIHFSI